MLVRVTGTKPPFVAGVVIGESGRVRVAAPILRWAYNLTEEELRRELRKRNLKASYTRTLKGSEMTCDGR